MPCKQENPLQAYFLDQFLFSEVYKFLITPTFFFKTMHIQGYKVLQMCTDFAKAT